MPPQTDCEELLSPSNGIKLSANLALKKLLGEDKDKDEDKGKKRDCIELLFASNGIKMSADLALTTLFGEDKDKDEKKEEKKRLHRAIVCLKWNKNVRQLSSYETAW